MPPPAQPTAPGWFAARPDGGRPCFIEVYFPYDTALGRRLTEGPLTFRADTRATSNPHGQLDQFMGRWGRRISDTNEPDGTPINLCWRCGRKFDCFMADTHAVCEAIESGRPLRGQGPRPLHQKLWRLLKATLARAWRCRGQWSTAPRPNRGEGD